MQKNTHFFPYDIYREHLAVMRGVKFTPREIDVISCLINMRGASKISSLLSISPNTVLAHAHNIMLKLGCNSREAIIDFIEQSSTLVFVKKHYTNLVIHAAFEKCLKDLSKVKAQTNPISLILYAENPTYRDVLIHYLKNHFKQAGIQAEIRREEADSKIKKTNERNHIVIFLLEKRNQEKTLEELFGVDFVDISEYQSYYFLVFDILKKLFPDVNFETILKTFTQQYNDMQSSLGDKDLGFNTKERLDTNAKGKIDQTVQFLKRKKGYFIGSAFFICLFLTLFQTFNWSKEMQMAKVNSEKLRPSIRSDLVIPTEPLLLHRPEIMAQLDEMFKKRQNGIQTVALIGPGGAGKTILARQYARQLDVPLVWELNAETYENLKYSFENLARNLARTEEEKKTLRELLEIKDLREREETLIKFVKEHLKTYSYWCLFYDNVENFPDIEKYFPQDEDTWGKGEVLLTTRNHHIQHNTQLKGIIQIGELNASQKLDLFIKIITNGEIRSFSANQREEAKKFLEQIPPYPLDISVAAYYLKTIPIPYAVYLQDLAQYDKNFVNLQENLLKEAGPYKKTRYSIISLSLNHLVHTHEDFANLLLFISLLDSQNIPRSLLDTYKDHIVVDNFIYHLKRYSLMTSESSLPSFGYVFSLHRSTQMIILNYLTSLLTLNKNKQAIQSIIPLLNENIREAIYKEDLAKLKFLLPHCEMVLNHAQLLTDPMKGSLESGLGSLLFSLGDYKKARELLEKSLVRLNQDHPKDYTKIAQILNSLGNVERELGNYEKAIDFMEQSHALSQKYFPKNFMQIAQILGYLGNVYRSAGDNKKAKVTLEKALAIYENHGLKDDIYIVQILGYLGIVNLELGNYAKSRDILEQALRISQKSLPENNVKIARILGCLGRAYIDLADYEKARNYLERSLAGYKANYPENHDKVAWALAHLGNVYKESGNYKKAKVLLEESLKIHQQKFKKDHPKIAWVSFDLGNVFLKLGEYKKAKRLFEYAHRVYREAFSDDNVYTALVLKSLGQASFLEGDMEAAEDQLKQALKIYQRDQHADIYMVLEILTELFLAKAEKPTHPGDLQQAKTFKKQAIDYLAQALQKVKAHFPKDSPHILRIHSKLKDLE